MGRVGNIIFDGRDVFGMFPNPGFELLAEGGWVAQIESVWKLALRFCCGKHSHEGRLADTNDLKYVLILWCRDCKRLPFSLGKERDSTILLPFEKMEESMEFPVGMKGPPVSLRRGGPSPPPLQTLEESLRSKGKDGGFPSNLDKRSLVLPAAFKRT